MNFRLDASPWTIESTMRLLAFEYEHACADTVIDLVAIECKLDLSDGAIWLDPDYRVDGYAPQHLKRLPALEAQGLRS